MVLITNISGRVLYRRHPRGLRVTFGIGETKDIKSNRLIKELSLQGSAFRVENNHLIPPKTNRRQTRKKRLQAKHTDNAIDTPKRIDSPEERAKPKGFGKPKQGSKPKGLKLPKAYFKLGMKNGWKKFKEDRAKDEGAD